MMAQHLSKIQSQFAYDFQKKQIEQKVETIKATKFFSSANAKAQRLLEKIKLFLWEGEEQSLKFEQKKMFLQINRQIQNQYLYLALSNCKISKLVCPNQEELYLKKSQLMLKSKHYKQCGQMVNSRIDLLSRRSIEVKKLSEYWILKYKIIVRTDMFHELKSSRYQCLRQSLKWNRYNRKAYEHLVSQLFLYKLEMAIEVIHQYIIVTGNQAYFLPMLAYYDLLINNTTQMNKKLQKINGFLAKSQDKSQFFNYFYFVGWIHLIVGHYEFQISVEKKSIDNMEDYFHPRKLLGIKFYKKKQYENALYHFLYHRETQNSIFKNIWGFKNINGLDSLTLLIARCYVALKDYQNGIQTLKYFNSLTKIMNPYTIVSLAQIYSKMGKVEMVQYYLDLLYRSSFKWNYVQTIQIYILLLINQPKLKKANYTPEQLYINLYKSIIQVAIYITDKNVQHYFYQTYFTITYAFENNLFQNRKELMKVIYGIIRRVQRINEKASHRLKQILINRELVDIQLICW